MITLYDSLSRQQTELRPLDPDRVTMYVCGPTVYDEPHIGNLRTAVVFDVLYRLLKHHYDRVEYARNFTDIDDKIMDRASSLGVPIDQLTADVIRRYHDVSDALNILRPQHEPRATESLDEIITMTSQLVAGGHAYVSQGHVLFSIASFPDHGRLSAHLQAHLLSGHRVAVADYKSGDNDFVLWKPSTPDQPGWPSPWGRGRPGWHIECSAMIRKHLGPTIDIHGGGADLRFPHHDSEISQSTCANHAPLASIWVHSAMLLVDGKKMSKSEGNMISAGSAINAYGGPVVRFTLMAPKYSKPLDWTKDLVEANARLLATWQQALEMVPAAAARNQHSDRILDPLRKNLNVQGVITNLQAAIRDLRATRSDQLAAGLLYSLGVLGLDLSAGPTRAADAELIGSLIDQRSAARASRDWAESDRLRAQLSSLGVAVEDLSDGSTRWKIV
jgi:cysteinyl-tRNA synthetase